jgi:hypothetical protein
MEQLAGLSLNELQPWRCGLDSITGGASQVGRHVRIREIDGSAKAANLLANY